jgi:hypothetical protein
MSAQFFCGPATAFAKDAKMSDFDLSAVQNCDTPRTLDVCAVSCACKLIEVRTEAAAPRGDRI